MLKILIGIFIFLFIIPIPVKITIKYYKNNLKIYIYKFKINLKEAEKKAKRNEVAKRVKKLPLMIIWNTLKNNNFKPAISLNLDTEYGFNDAAYTGIFYGIIYSIYPLISEFLNKVFKVKNFSLNVIPDFNNKIIKFSLNCIIFFNLVKLIYILLLVLININKAKKVRFAST